MKIKGLLFTIAIFTTTFALQGESARIVREYKVGDKVNFNLTVSAGTAMGDLDVAMKIEQKVLKLADNGDVTIESNTSGTVVKFNGQEMQPDGGAIRTTTLVLTKEGLPKKSAAQGSGGLNLGFVNLANLIYNKDLKVGVETPVDVKDPDDTKNFAKGVMKLESVESGIAKVVAKLDLNNDSSVKPMKVVMTAYMNIGKGIADKVEGTATDLPPVQSIEIKAIQFVMERVK